MSISSAKYSFRRANNQVNKQSCLRFQKIPLGAHPAPTCGPRSLHPAVHNSLQIAYYTARAYRSCVQLVLYISYLQLVSTALSDDHQCLLTMVLDDTSIASIWPCQSFLSASSFLHPGWSNAGKEMPRRHRGEDHVMTDSILASPAS